MQYTWNLIKPKTGPIDQRRPVLHQQIADAVNAEELDGLVVSLGGRPDFIYSDADTLPQRALLFEFWVVKYGKREALLRRLEAIRPNVEWS